MLNYLLQGLVFGLAYVAPIGMQNLYVINSALKYSKIKAYQVSMITVFFDISLALCCFFGVGLIVDKMPFLKGAIMLIGSLAVLYIGYGLLKSNGEINDNVEVETKLSKIIYSCFAVTWLNPQALIDGSLILGGYNTSVPKGMVIYFIIGVCTASFLWFNTLATLVSVFKTKINSKIIRIINVVCGLFIIYFGLKLAYSFIKFAFL